MKSALSWPGNPNLETQQYGTDHIRQPFKNRLIEESVLTLQL
jgi:hypothetical protein